MSKFSCFSFFIFVILFSSFDSVSAQLKDNFLKGSIVLQNGQTADGFVQDDELAKMNVHVNFKSSEAEKRGTTYDASSIKSLTLENGEMYQLIHFQGKYMGSSASMLAKVLVKGKASLYQGYYNNDPIFIITNNGNSFVLQNDKLEQGATELTLYDFKIVVHNALFDATLPPNKIEKSSFSEKDFI